MTREVEVTTDIPTDAWGEDVEQRREALLEELRTKVAEAGWDPADCEAEIRIDPVRLVAGGDENMVRMTMTAWRRR